MGKIIVIEGLDGTGKETQTMQLYKNLKSEGKNVHKISFPNYDSRSSELVKMYLSGEIAGEGTDLNPYMCSSFYAADRAIQYYMHFKNEYEQEDSIIIADRYISANIIHQGGKIKDVSKREEFYLWTYDYEVGKLGIPKPDITIVLRIPPWKSRELLNKRYNGEEKKKDVHERNLEYLDACDKIIDEATMVLNNNGHKWVQVNCLDGSNNLRTIEDIAYEIKSIVQDIL